MSRENRPDGGTAADEASLVQLQTEFAAHIRDPENAPAPEDVEDRRMKIYRDLFFNNMQSMLASNFPVLHQLHGKSDWRGLIRDFYAHYRCQTPLFTEIAREFLRYLQDVREPREDDMPFLLELAHYEWVEMALELDEKELDDVDADPAGDLMAGVPQLSPLAWPLSYRFPVHRIKPGYLPREAPPEPTHLLVYRNRDDAVKFMHLNGVSRLLLDLMRAHSDLNGRELLQRVAGEIGHPDPESVIKAGADLLEDFRARDIIVGSRREHD